MYVDVRIHTHMRMSKPTNVRRLRLRRALPSALCAAEAPTPSPSGSAAPASPNAAAGTGPAAADTQRYVVAGAGVPAVNGEYVLEYSE